MESLYGSDNLVSKSRKMMAGKTEEEMDEYFRESRRVGVLN